nr:hypothetical protein [Tanacetum cinerariifolium]
RTASIQESDTSVLETLKALSWKTCQEGSLNESVRLQSDAAEGFKQIIDFVSGSYIYYALTVNPHIYISCIKQFWNTASVKRSVDVTRHSMLSNKEIFTGLAQMGYEKLSTKLTFYKAFFFSQWKFLIRTILQSLSAKRTSWNKFSMAMASAVICLSKVGDLSTHNTRFFSPALTQKVFANMRRVGKGFSRVETPLFEGMLAERQPAEDEVAEAQCDENLENDNAAQKLVIIKLKARVKRLEKANLVKSSKLRRLRKVGTSKQVESSDAIEDVFNQGRMIDDMDKDKEIKLEVVEVVTTAKLITDVVADVASQVNAASATLPAARLSILIDDMDKDKGIELVKDADITKSEGRHATEQAEQHAEIYHIDLDHSSKVLSMQEDDSKVQEVVKVVTIAKLITKLLLLTQEGESKGILVETLKPIKKKDQIELDAEYARKLHEEINRDKFNKDIDWDAAMDHVNQKSNNPQYIKRYQGMKKRPQTESEAHKNMMIYLKNTAGYKMDFFKGMTEEMEEEDQEIIKSINETSVQKAAKRSKLSEEAQEVEDLRKRLEVVDDDVFIEATPLARKVLVVDYHIVLVDNKHRFKIIKADETHQFYISFTTLLKNFDREYLESLWRIVKDRFSTSKPTNFLDEYLLLTLKTIFEKPDKQDAVWKIKEVFMLFLLVKRRYPLSRFTLEQLVNVERLQVEEENEMSLELLRNNSFLQQSAPTFDQLFEINDLKAQSQEKDTVIVKLKERLKSLSGTVKEEKIKRELEEIETINIELDHRVTKLVAKNEHLKQTYKKLYDSIKSPRVRSKEQCDDLIKQVNIKSGENSDLNASLQEKVLVITALKETLSKLKGKFIVNEALTLHPIDPELLKIDVAPLALKLRNNRTAHTDYLRHTQEETATLREIVESEKLLNSLNTSLDYACKYTKRIQELLIILQQTCPCITDLGTKLMVVTPKNNDKKIRLTDHIPSSGNTPVKTTSSTNIVSNIPVLSST